jgi:DNA modification methylase
VLPSVTILEGDALERLRELPSESIQMCVTSPPYWGLRDYGIAPSTWGGDPACDHDFALSSLPTEKGKGNWAQGTNGRGELQPGGVDAKREPLRAVAERGFCTRCGAWRGCLGLEPTPELFVKHQVMIFEEVRRVLKPDGTLWCNMGDSYAGSGQGFHDKNSVPNKGHRASQGVKMGSRHGESGHTSGKAPPAGLKTKDLCGMPWRLAFALQAAGWYLRCDIIWHKPNPMPESVTDRPTKAHEYIFLMSKSQRYYYNQDAILEPAGKTNGNMKAVGRSHAASMFPGSATRDENRRGLPDLYNGSDFTKGKKATVHQNIGQGERHGKMIQLDESGQHHGQNARRQEAGSFSNDKSQRTGRKMAVPGSGIKTNSSFDEAVCLRVEARNKRTVWTVPTHSFKEAHFATFPPDLIKPCILAGSRAGDMVIDPFGGSGTTGMVAIELGRNATLIELNPEYAAMARRRCLITPGLNLETK